MPLCSFIYFTGIPVFCNSTTPQLSVTLNQKASISVIVCGNPKVTLHYKWNHEGTRKSIKMTNSIGINRYQALIETNHLTKRYCGRDISFFTQNSLGKSTPRSTAVDVLCKYCVSF